MVSTGVFERSEVVVYWNVKSVSEIRDSVESRVYVVFWMWIFFVAYGFVRLVVRIVGRGSLLCFW